MVMLMFFLDMRSCLSWCFAPFLCSAQRKAARAMMLLEHIASLLDSDITALLSLGHICLWVKQVRASTHSMFLMPQTSAP